MALSKKPVNGMKDILPEEMQIRDYVQGVIKDTYRSFGFTPIETPCMENIGNLSSKQGGENEKLIFKILKRGEKLKLETAEKENDLVDSGLRYDLTVPLCRYYSNNANELPSPFKALQMGNVWRADRPQRGRYRQFMQCDIDILGEPTNLAEIELILAKQLFIETSRQDKPFETAEDILMHLLDGGFPSASYFRLQTVGTYLADFHPFAFALIDLTAYHSQYLGTRHLKQEIGDRFPDSHSFLYKGDVFLFLHKERDAETFSDLEKEFGLKVIVSDPIHDLFALPLLYRAAHDALDMIVKSNYHGGNVCSVSQLRTPLLLKSMESRAELIPPALRALAEHDAKKQTQYCETLYYYLVYSRSLKKTCDALFTHRNTVLYRIGRMRDDFLIPLDDPARHTELLLGTALLLFQKEGPDFFMRVLPQADDEETRIE